jgi:hypothetical protein
MSLYIVLYNVFHLIMFILYFVSIYFFFYEHIRIAGIYLFLCSVLLSFSGIARYSAEYKEAKKGINKRNSYFMRSRLHQSYAFLFFSFVILVYVVGSWKFWD